MLCVSGEDADVPATPGFEGDDFDSPELLRILAAYVHWRDRKDPPTEPDMVNCEFWAREVAFVVLMVRLLCWIQYDSVGYCNTHPFCVVDYVGAGILGTQRR